MPYHDKCGNFEEVLNMAMPNPKARGGNKVPTKLTSVDLLNVIFDVVT